MYNDTFNSNEKGKGGGELSHLTWDKVLHFIDNESIFKCSKKKGGCKNI